MLCCGNAPAAVRSVSTSTVGIRQSSGTQRVSTSGKNVRTSVARTPTMVSARSGVIRNNPVANVSRSANVSQSTLARAANNATSVSETRTGADYERCKTAYFTCMDQFCLLKNDDYRRCSCTNRVNELAELISGLQDAGNQLSEFTENLDVVGMTAAQAKSMHTPSDGETALAADTSASKAILQAIMNSIRGESAAVTGKYSELNSLNLSFDTVNAFGTTDIGQTIAAYNGQNLYAAVYPQCRQVVRADCNDASLQRAITAYLMAMEQDCNTVQTAIENKQAQLRGALREGSAMLDLARIENRQNRNSYNFTQCVNNVEQAILSEEVCGAGYHKCLDNGQYIDISTGAPIKGVPNFYKLGELLTFDSTRGIPEQKLAKMSANGVFVRNFESRVKKFAEPALAKCVENADDVWADYLDKAMVDIYYAQQDKVAEIKQGCFDFVSSCYMNGDASITAAMRGLIDGNDLIVQPDAIALNGALCTDYVKSCDNMFDTDSDKGGIIAQYIENRQNTDVLTACRAIVKQCFDSYGGTNYENFYYPYSGLFDKKTSFNAPFASGSVYAPDWFTLYDENGNILSECAQQLTTVAACKDVIETAFGGFDRKCATSEVDKGDITYTVKESCDVPGTYYYGKVVKVVGDTEFINRGLRAAGVATEIYNQIVDILSINCSNLGGSFITAQNVGLQDGYTVDVGTGSDVESGNICKLKKAGNFGDGYGILDGENMCPLNYDKNVDINSWGFCSCWENGYRRSKNGQTVSCFAGLPIQTEKDADSPKDRQCYAEKDTIADSWDEKSVDNWCTAVNNSSIPVCPLTQKWNSESKKCECQSGLVWNETSKKCECQSGLVWNETSKKCETSSGS
ncbi:MAG: hypothetical protein ACLRFJ_01335 [Alphaproteobacteria bacterium]